jgi:hypothetical protein
VSFPPFYKVQASRVITVAASDFVGERDLLWYDRSGVLRVGDGVTPGGIPINFGGAISSSTFNNNVLPGTTNIYDLGSISNQWKTLYLSSSTFYVGGNTVTIGSTGTILINGIPISGGSEGIIGYTGSRGEIGYTGSAGTGGGGSSTNLVFTEVGDKRILTGFVDPDGETFSVRTTEISNSGSFIINLASFSPIFTAVALPSSTLNWDQSVTGFRVTVNNPDDFLTKYISSVFSVEQVSGFVTDNINLYTSIGPSPNPNYGIDWQETFSTNSFAVIRSTSSTLLGGSASGRVKFNVIDIATGQATEYMTSSTVFSVSWATPTLSISMADLSGNTFLQSYTQTSYSIAVTGISNSINYTLSVSAVGATPTNVLGNGILIFATPIHKNNTGETRTVSVTGTFNRPVTVTGSAYSVGLSAADTTLNSAFSYPSFWLWTTSVNVVPTVSNIVNGTSFATGVTVLNNQVRTFAATVNNIATVPRVFWFGVRSSAAQPSSFQTGLNASLLSSVSTTNGTVQLGPSPLPAGYNLENYNLYGIILQPGNTYVSIS